MAYAETQRKTVRSSIDINKTPKQDRELYLQAIAKKPDDNYLRMHFSQYLTANQQSAAAIKELEVVCGLLPDLEWPHYFLGQHLGQAKRYAEATNAFQRALDIRSDFTLAQEGLDKINRLKR